jgi:hypothetical protein
MSRHEDGKCILQLIVITILTLLAIGCLGITPHENFKAHLRGEIGRGMDNAPSYSWRNEKDKIDSKVLPNGNIENKYKYQGSCVYYFEVDPKTRKIVGTRFEGSEKDCVVNP